MRKTLLGLLLAAGCALAAAQPISADEMIQLERLHDEMTAKGVRVTPEMEGRMLQRIRALGALNADPRRAASPPPMLAVAPAATSTTSLSEPELLRRLQELQASAQPIGAIEYLRDGLVVDGRRFADPEGRTTGVSVDAATGRVGYFVEGAVPGSGTLKLARADRPAEAVTIGRLQREGAGWQLTTVTGATLTGELFFPLTDGALLMRDSVGFRYVAGRGVEQVTVPTGWYPTPLQRGNVATTG